LGASLRLARGRVAGVDEAPRKGDHVVDMGGALVLPGLVNAHDHLELNNFPRLKWREQYANAREWIADFQPRFDSDPALALPRSAPLADRLLVGGLKNLLSGVTTVCHHNPLHRPLRRGFPVRVVTRYRFSHSLHIDGDARVRREFQQTPKSWPWIIHAAEGADAEAMAEFDQLDRMGCLAPNTLLVHGVGLLPAQRARLAEHGGGLIWCPSSNLFTLGQTAEVGQLAAARKVALGSDSRLSGERDLLAELQVAASLGQVDAQTLFRMVTADAASLLRLPDAGRLDPGCPADLIVLPAPRCDPYAGLLAPDRSKVRLVMIGGRPLYADLDLWALFIAAGVRPEPVWVDGCEKLLADWIVARLRKASIGEAGLHLDPQCREPGQQRPLGKRKM
jgi:cytosine/adenosine deaminase-related metal-dependent hydrolase